MASYMELELANACYKLMHDLIRGKERGKRTDYSRFQTGFSGSRRNGKGC